MRLVSLREDSGVFGQQVNRTLYLLFKNRSDDFVRMIKDQTPAFWVGFTITLHDVLWKEGLAQLLLKKKVDFTEPFFVWLHDLLISGKPERVVMFMTDVVAMARYSKFMNCLEATQAEYHAISTDIDGMVSFERLFGDRRNENTPEKVYQTHGLSLLAVGSLLTVFKHWLTAPASDKVDWCAPLSWTELKCPSLFLWHVKKQWGHSLLKMLAVRSSISWWDSKTAMEKQTHTEFQQLCFVNDDRSSVLRKLEFNEKREKPLTWFSSISSSMERACLTSIRQLYFTDCRLVFHPYAQFPSCLHGEVIGPHLWKSNFGVRGLFYNLLWKTGGKRKSSDMQIAGNLFCNVLDVYVEVKKAIQMDASFHDSVTCGTTWTSPETLARLLWNMPLCIKWLEWLLVQIYRFEISFLPFCHFPVRKRVLEAMGRMHTMLSHEPRFLAKAAIIVADKIWLEEVNEDGMHRTCSLRDLLKFCLERLVPIMKCFNDESCYSLLKFILEEGWTRDERLTGEISPLTSRNDFSFVCNGPTADINIDLSFSDNFRSTSYWLRFKELPSLEFTEDQHSEAIAKIEYFKKIEVNRPALPTSREYCPLKYDLQYYQKFAVPGTTAPQSKRFVPEDIIHACATMHQAGFVKDSVLHQFNFNVMTKMQELSTPGAVEKLPGLDSLHQLIAVFYLSSFEAMSLAKEPMERQDMLGNLQFLEWHMMIMDVAGRLCALLNMFTPHIGCPTTKYFTLSFAQISNRPSKTVITSIDQANNFLKSLASEKLFGRNSSYKEPKGFEIRSLPVDPVKELESKRVELLSAVAKVQDETLLIFGGQRHGKFPLFSELEYRFVEELAALRKSREMGNRQAEQRLVQLLSFRMNWLKVEYENWIKGTGREETKLFDLSQDDKLLLSAACNLKAKVLAVLIHLKSIFCAYLSPFRTTHPFSETSEGLLLRLLEVLITNSKNSVTRLPSALLYSSLVTSGLSYLEKLLQDCMEVWCVPELYSNPTVVPEDVIEHAQLVHVAISQLLLMLTNKQDTLDGREPVKMVQAALSTMVEAGTLLRLGGLDSRSDVLEKVKGHYLEVYGTLSPLAQTLQLSERGLQLRDFGWLGLSEQWLDCVYTIKTGCLTPFFEKIKFDEFMAKKFDKPMKTVNTGDDDDDVSKDKSVNCDKIIGSCAVEIVPGDSVGRTADSDSMGNLLRKDSSDGCEAEIFKNDDVAHTNPDQEETATTEYANNSTFVPLNCCFECQKKEQTPQTFKKCKKCVSERWTVIRVYCSSDCRVTDWNRRHGHEHLVGEQESDYNADENLDID